MAKKTLRSKLIDYAQKNYDCSLDFPWAKLPDYFVLRHQENNKWFALFMIVPRHKLGLEGDGNIDILNLKVEPTLNDILVQQPGYLPAYHMKRRNWITILLDGSVSLKEIKPLLEMSYNLTIPKNKVTNPSYRNTKWIVPANPKYYDIESVIANSPDGTFTWKQSNRILVGDIVYLYLAAPVSAIQYRCEAIEVDIPYRFSDENVHMTHIMRLKVLEVYADRLIDYAFLSKRGVKSIRGPRKMPILLEQEIDSIYHKQ